MYQLLFRNRIIALVFVVATILGVRTLIGTEDENGALTQTTAQIQANVRAMQDEARHFQARQNNAMSASQPVATGFAADEEPIEPGEGLDPRTIPPPPPGEEPVFRRTPVDTPDIVVPKVVGGN